MVAHTHSHLHTFTRSSGLTFGVFPYSEIRLMEIVEGLCDSSSFECNRMLEEHEEHFETWWFKRWVLANSSIVKVLRPAFSATVASWLDFSCQHDLAH